MDCHRCGRRTVARKGRSKRSLCSACRNHHNEGRERESLLTSAPLLLPFVVREERVELYTQLLDELTESVKGYKLKHKHVNVGDPQWHMTRVDAMHKGRSVGFAVFAHKGDKIKPTMVKVEPEHRRKGLATALYDRAQKITGKTVMRGDEQTDDGSSFRKAYNQKKKLGEGRNVKFLPARSTPELSIEPFNGMAIQMGDDDPTLDFPKRRLIQPIRYEPNRVFRFNAPKDR